MNLFPSARSASQAPGVLLSEAVTLVRPLFPLWRYGAWFGAFVALLVINLLVRLGTQSYMADVRTYEHRADVSKTELGQLALELDVRRGASHLQKAASMYGLTAPVALETVALAAHDLDAGTP